jgi:cellulose synthase/poly-beta-1,6-N-acetylglucosamine synthase-like glycosyltransferase
MEWMGYVLWGVYALTIIWILINGLFQLHLLWFSKRKKKVQSKTLPAQLPFVTVQLPVYNERFVIEGLLQSVARLDYPKDLLEIQVLDDSTDETLRIIDQQVDQLRSDGFNITVLRREDREGYKAGALQYGLGQCKGDFIAIFDADFRPPADFLMTLMPYFVDEHTGLVQARWGHLNKEENFLTRIQSLLLDVHFKVEQAGRYNAGYFTNFCGTAGIWRKRCILDAGGWDSSVLSEDLELSYRAQLKGWHIVYDQDIIVPAEVPSVMEAFKVQQFRWTKGIAQTARKTLGRLIGSRLSPGKKVHAVFQLSSSIIFLCLLINALLTVPLLIFRQLSPEFVTLTNYTSVGALNLVVLTLLYYNGTREQETAKQFFKSFPLFLVVYLAMSVQNAVAVLQGISGHKSAFVRTPKFSGSSAVANQYLNKKISWITLFEIALFGYFLSGIALSIYFNDYFLMLFFGMMCWGLGVLIFHSVFHLTTHHNVKPKPAYHPVAKL